MRNDIHDSPTQLIGLHAVFARPLTFELKSGCFGFAFAVYSMTAYCLTGTVCTSQKSVYAPKTIKGCVVVCNTGQTRSRDLR